MNETDRLLSELTSGDDARAESAAARLAQLGERILPRLRQLMESKDSDDRWWAVRTLAAMSSSSLELLARSLRDQSSDVRAAAALGLAAHPAEASVPALLAALEDEDNLVSGLCVRALVAIGSAGVPALVEAMPRASQRGRIGIMRALTELKDPRAIRVMLDAAEADSAILSFWAREGLDALGLGMVYLMPK